MNRRFALVSAAAMAVFVLYASDQPTAQPLPAPRVRVRHMTADAVAINPDLDEMARAQEALRVLVTTHPAREIREDLNRLIIEERVMLNFQDILTKNAGNFASTTLLSSGDHTYLTLAVSPTMLLDGSTSHDLQQMIIYHEYIHIRQALDGTVPAWTFAPREAAGITEEYIRYFLAAETEAYEAECLFANEIHSDITLEFCVVYDQHGRQAMREAFAQELTSRPGWEGLAEPVMRIARNP